MTRDPLAGSRRALGASIAALAAIAGLASPARAQGVAPAVRAHAVRRTGPIAVDGRLDEPVWASAPRQTGFVQRFPRDAARASAETHFAIVYDDEAIFVGVWADDARPELIRALLTRRDVDSTGDKVTVAFDSYHDRRTAYAFTLNAAGVQRDMLLFDDSNQDDTWDAVWTGDVAITPAGWTAEYRIPLGQLRFVSQDSQEWGVQVLRYISRTGEQDSWSPWPRGAPQVVSKFGIVDGIEHLKAARRLELLPYATGGFDRLPVASGDPLNQQYNLHRNFGGDLKYGLGPAFTLSATINPDFGQVEADPSKVNLSANELFFAEKRPFFLEGVDLFKLPLGDDDSAEGAFYSRRIGATPPDRGIEHTYIKAPGATTIYGAAKLTGKTPSGWSVGVLDALTSQEAAEVCTAAAPGMPCTPGTRVSSVVAALTNYAIARVKRDIDEGKTSIGASATAVNRSLDGTGDLRKQIHDQAYTGGLQLQHRWGDNAWIANVSLLGSWVHGSREAIEATQQNPRHYFQRPDAADVHVDDSRTSLSGLAASWRIGRLGETRHWRFGAGGDLRTAGLELNDAGFQVNSDRTIPFFLAEYREDEPSAHVLNWQLSSDVYWAQTLEPRLTDYGIECNGRVQFANYWSLGVSCNFARSLWNVDALRGGPALRVDSRAFSDLNLVTDTRKPVWFSFNESDGHNWTSGELDVNLSLTATIQARPNLDLSVGPSVYWRDDPLQYIANEPDASGRSHYAFGRIRETDVSATLRVNWTFSPHLALQAYAQPYLASGRYSELKDVDNPGARLYADRFRLLSSADLQLVDGKYQVVRNGAAWAFDRPDFNFRQLRSTVVLRWEYRPGSTVFAIWSHGQTSDAFVDGRFRIGRDLSDLTRAPSENIVLVKANYWIGL